MSSRLHAWMARNARTQGYCVAGEDLRALRVGLRFPTAVCLALVGTALALQSAPFVAALAALGLVAGFSARHPFDHLWNHGVRRLLDAPPVPPSPTRRRHAFKVAGTWLAIVAALFAAGASTAALIAGATLMVACSAVTVFNLCIPSEVLAWWERRNAVGEVVAR